MSRLNTGALSSRGSSQNPVVTTIVYSVAERSTTRRPNHSHASSISATPAHSRIEDSTSPCPNRNHDRCIDSSTGSLTRVLPAPSPPAAIRAAPRAPSRAGRPSGDSANSFRSRR